MDGRNGIRELTAEGLADSIMENGPRLRALAFRMLGDRNDADDAVQGAYLRALRSLGGFRGDASMATWLYTITSNVCLDELRRRRHRPVLAVDSDDAAPSPVVADFADASVSRAGLADALAGLSTPQREAFVLVAVWGFDYAEAGAHLGVPPGTVGSRVHRAKQAIRQFLDSSEDRPHGWLPLDEAA